MDKAKQRAQQAQQKLEESGALDKAKQAAQQAQQKIEEKQQEVNR
ncbi:MAG: Uma2 family endonuclease, partial [Thermoleophilaceae bacterium]|nr:Uma2 family endonuclease [Thermoleophilaceae bacterium]